VATVTLWSSVSVSGFSFTPRRTTRTGGIHFPIGNILLMRSTSAEFVRKSGKQTIAEWFAVW
jgi:hypothetical protein